MCIYFIHINNKTLEGVVSYALCFLYPTEGQENKNGESEMENKKRLKSLVALAICFSMALLPVMQAVSAQTETPQAAALQEMNAVLPQVNALNAEISPNLNTYAQQLSTNVAFTTTPALYSGTTPVSEGATYYSIDVGATTLNNSVITFGSVYGNIWAANGTYLYTYEAFINPTTLQIVNVIVYPYLSADSSNSVTLPSISGVNVYTIGEPNTPAQQVSTASSSSTSVTQSSDSGGVWCGYSVEDPNEQYMQYAYMQSTVVSANTGNYGLGALGVSVWDGLSFNDSGGPNLYQGGWQAIGRQDFLWENWNYSLFVEDWPANALLGPTSPNVGDTVTAIENYYPSNNDVVVQAQDGSDLEIQTFPCSGSQIPLCAHFIVEDPETGGNRDHLAGWSNPLNETNGMAMYIDNNGNPNYENLGWYLQAANGAISVSWLINPFGTIDAEPSFYYPTNTMIANYLSSQ